MILQRLSRFTTLAAVLALAISLATPNAAAQNERFTPEHIAKTRGVTSALMSPDGTHIAYTLSVPRNPLEEKNGSAWTELHILEVESGKTRPYITGDVSVRSPHWTPDGTALTFLAKRDGDDHTSLYEIPIGGGEARRLLAHETSISSYAMSPDGARVAFLAKEKEPKEEKKWKDKGFDALVYEENLTDTRVWTHDLKAGDDAKPRLLEDVKGNASGLSWSPAGDRLVIALAPNSLVDLSYMRKKVNVIDAESGAIVRTLDNVGKLGKVRFSPDGKHLAMICAADASDTSDGRLFLSPTDGGELKDLLPQYTDRDVLDFEWQGNDAIMLVGAQSVHTFFSEVKLDGTEKVIVAPGGAILGSVTLNRAGTAAAFVAETPQHPDEVFMMTHGDTEPKRVTNSNPWLDDMELATQEVVKYQARDGLEIHGLLIRPLDEQPGQRYPLILTVHGGPEAHYSNGWLTRYSGAGQLGAAEGYAVFYPNYRGSTGRGVEFAKTSQADAAGAEFDDLVDGVDHLIETGLVDKDRVGITGGSYGGYASAWGATYYSERFAASVMFVGISNNISKTGTTDIPLEMHEVHHLKWLWEDWEYFLTRSPIYHIEKAKTPLLIMHGKDDPRVHPGQSMELYRHVKVRGETPVRLVLFPGEGHGNRKAAGRLDYTLRMMRWFDHYLKGDGDRRKKPAPPAQLDYEALFGDVTD